MYGIAVLRKKSCMTNPNAPPQTATAAPSTRDIAAQTTAVTVLFTNNQAALMDEIIAAIRRNTGKPISRSALMRAIVSAVLPYFPDWLQCASVAALQQKITTRLKVGTK